MFLFLLLLLVLNIINLVDCYRPVVLMHGLMASKEAMSHYEKFIKEDFPGIYVHNVEIGNGRADSLFMNINKQVEQFAQHVKSDPKLRNGFNLIGHSQGGLVTRAFIERFNDPPVHNWISLAGPQFGVYGVPDFNALCPPEDCPWIASLFSLLDDPNTDILGESIQKFLSFAAYWHDPFNEQEFAKRNIFLADINNANTVNATYKHNFSSLNKALLIYSTTDTIVVPRVSPWFSFYDYVSGSDSTILKFNETPLYKNDLIGLKTLNDTGRLAFATVPCEHQNIPRLSCKPYYTKLVKPLLNN